MVWYKATLESVWAAVCCVASDAEVGGESVQWSGSIQESPGSLEGREERGLGEDSGSLQF